MQGPPVLEFGRCKIAQQMTEVAFFHLAAAELMANHVRIHIRAQR